MNERHAEPPVIPAGARFEGTLCWRGDVRVEGRLEGQAVGGGLLEIGPQAQVRGEVTVDELVIAGSLEGDATASQRIELLPGARVVGDLRAPVVSVADGCRLEGRLVITPKGATGASGDAISP